MKKPVLHALALAGLSSAMLPPATAQMFPAPIDYVMQLQSSVQSNSNPARLSESNGDKKSSTVLVNTLGLAARIPLLSEDTRLDIAGVAGDARYSAQHQLDHHPRRLDTTLHWRAGRLFNGKVGYQYDRKRYESDRLWPDSDMVSTRRVGGEVGLNVSERLTLPLIGVFDERTRYDALPNQQRFDRNTRGWQVSARYQGPTGSSVRTGFAYSTTDFPLRHAAGLLTLDDKYNDRELFAETFWQYSVKTSLFARAGWLQRRYANFDERNTNLLTLDAQASWQYSPKTELRLALWQRPYNNDDNPDALYSTTTGVGIGALWQATAKVSLALNAAYESQKDRSAGSIPDESSRTMRYGSRLAWQAGHNISIVLDGYHARKHSDSPWNRYTQNIVRLGLVLYTDSGNPQVAPMLRSRECQWAYSETDLCQ